MLRKGGLGPGNLLAGWDGYNDDLYLLLAHREPFQYATLYAAVKGRECLILLLGHAQQSPGLQHVLCWEKYHQSVRFFSSRSNLHSVGKLLSGTVK